jgi:hypothetical protein
MRATLRKSIAFKDGTVWEAGQDVIIEVKETAPMIAVLYRDGMPKRVRSASLYKWFDEFISFGMDDLEGAVMDCSCPSLTGVEIEPDGWDSEGFPSILLAAGVI